MSKEFLVLGYAESYEDKTEPERTKVDYWKGYFAEREGGDSVIGYVEQATEFCCAAGLFQLRAGMYFASPAPVYLTGGSGFCMTVRKHKPQFMIGGPIEEWGRLKYIDGCTDSLLIPPVRFGDPCLNALYFPPGIVQTQHTHPSLRAGLVVEGRGLCLTPGKETPLVPGVCFIIETDSLHHFATPDGESMIVVAFHPDSDMGPKDEDHPMVNRTIVEGVSASKIEEIRTK